MASEDAGVEPPAKRRRSQSPAAKQPAAAAAEVDIGERWCSDLRRRRVLAPMVRVNILPFRLLAAKHGAEVVYSEEIIAQKLAKTSREVDAERGVVEYVLREQHGKAKLKQFKRSVVFATPVRADRSQRPEGAHVVLQIGANSAEAAVKAALHVEQDVDGIDLNMGCPKSFSVKGGMGAALLTQPAKVREILTALVAAVRVPVSCKIRLLPDRKQMNELLHTIRESGVSCLTIHARYPPQRSSEPPRYEELGEVLSALEPRIPFPVMLSGDVWWAGDADECGKALERCGGDSAGVVTAMVARGALLNPTVFAGPAKLDKVAAHRELLRHHLRHGGNFHCAKYTLTRSFQDIKAHAELHRGLTGVKDMREACLLLGMEKGEVEEMLAKWSDPFQMVVESG
eukprot:TRINITY_DN44326_c0_g1_i1.p1 TRINITY_DN44326_c0_g1~~TRINITY_DN44326_c0_g1_i1.p1  ORF type:complete len:399 (+),score=171.02 TRINITY_DN44326_c0_g1_i1:110-1306(+)